MTGAPAVGAPGTFPIVAIGASAGGLGACSQLLDAIAPDTGMAFIVVQHLDPHHRSLLVELLATHTRMPILEASDGLTIAPNHVYVIPPGAYLSIDKDALRLSPTPARIGSRAAFDFLLESVAESNASQAICIILSGTGADGSTGLKAIREKGGLVIAQEPEQAEFAGMPQSAIMTGAVDLVLAIEKMPAALDNYRRGMSRDLLHSDGAKQDGLPNWLPKVIDLLRLKTAHDFTLYKPGTLQRRIQRRMAIEAIDPGESDRYLDLLRANPTEVSLLAKDLLINVTSFFRDPAVFDMLRNKYIPSMLQTHPAGQPLRIWVAGCSTGEEAYSLSMIFQEALEAAGMNVKLQVFGSDVDEEAVVKAREGVYSKTIELDVSPERLARFFIKEDDTYKVSADLRSTVIFTIQDVLADPPFARLSFISCRNLLIYLGAEAQAKVMSTFHFGLLEHGVLFLGGSETVNARGDQFSVISRQDRLFKRSSHRRPGETGFSVQRGNAVRVPEQMGTGPTRLRSASLADLAQRVVIDAYAPAAVLINQKNECLFYLGPTHRYLQVAPGHATQDIYSMAGSSLRAKLRSAIQQARQGTKAVVLNGSHSAGGGEHRSINIEVHQVSSDRNDLLLVCFVVRSTPEVARVSPSGSGDSARIVELENELAATRTELEGAIRNLEVSAEEERSLNEETLSINEEFQSTNEELLTSKEELQSLNEELTALNAQLQETLSRQRTTSDDLQNILFSTDVATLFLDTNLRIRFYTPATKTLFRLIPSDIGRPLADLHALAPDSTLTADARTLLEANMPITREIEGVNGSWFLRRVMAYRTQASAIEGVVVTFTDVTDRKRIMTALEEAKFEAETATAAKSKFLAAASHDLRQPLQTLVLVQGMLAKIVEGEKAAHLVARLDETLGSMAAMLDTLLDLNKIAAGSVPVEKSIFQISGILDRLRDEFTYHAHAKGLDLTVISSSVWIYSDPHLLEQMIRNLLSNALKYTEKGRVLLGCRQQSGSLNIEIWDTGIGIPATEHAAIFEEYHQIDNAARERSRGLGLGLSIVQQLAKMLGHRIWLRSEPGRGSVFAIQAAIQPAQTVEATKGSGAPRASIEPSGRRMGAILLIEDDPEVRYLLELMLKDEGHMVTAAPDGVAALELMSKQRAAPDLILADYNLPNGMTGVQLAIHLRKQFKHDIPTLILTGDASSETERVISRENFQLVGKPVRLLALTGLIQQSLKTLSHPLVEASLGDKPQSPLNNAAGNARLDHGPENLLYVVDDDDQICKSMREIFEGVGWAVEDFPSSEAFLDAYRAGRGHVLLVDAYLPGMTGLQLLARLDDIGAALPSIVITGVSDVPMAVNAMKAGASDFIEKPIHAAELLASVNRALDQAKDNSKLSSSRETAIKRMSGLTNRQRQIMELVLAGQSSKVVAAGLGISPRTVETHRALIMQKMGANSLPALARMALLAAVR